MVAIREKLIFHVLLLMLLYLNDSKCSSVDQDYDTTTNLRRHYSHSHEFDFIIFTQQWPATNCFHWMSIDPNHQCQLPSPKRIWTIHGLWPTKEGELGPFYCNPDMEFDINKIKSKLYLLEQFWVNIQKGTPLDSLWRHEWEKHGTCAAQLVQLNNEDKYFGQGLNWLQQYQMSNVLEKSNIMPDHGITVRDIHNAIYKEIKAIPVIHCIDDKETHVQYLHELRICFNKTLNIMDCTGAIPGDKVWISDSGSYASTYTSDILTNCDVSREVHYPATVPPTRFRKEMEREWKFPFVNFYKLIRIVKWMTF